MLFDHDDTLVDWLGSIRVAGERVLDPAVVEALIVRLAERAWDRRGDLVIDRNTWRILFWFDELLTDVLPEADAADRALIQRQFFDELWIGFYPDTVPALDGLVDRFRLGLLSNNGALPHEVERLRLHDWFEVAIALPPDRRKPDPAGFAEGLRALDVRAEHAVYVGDSIRNDAEGALNAGMISVWVDRFGDRWDPPPGVHRIASLTELDPLLERLAT